MTFGARSAEVIPPLQGRHGLMRLMLALRSEPEPDGQGPTDLADALRAPGASRASAGS